MSLAGDLLEQARHLANREPRRPKQASLRRAISAAYYAVFHLLTDEVAARLAPRQPEDLKYRVQRAIGHADMKKACANFSKSQLPPHLNFPGHGPVPSELIKVARIFVALQEARHGADYDLSSSVNRLDALALLQEAEDAFASWRIVRNTPYANVFLSALLLGDRTKRP